MRATAPTGRAKLASVPEPPEVSASIRRVATVGFLLQAVQRDRLQTAAGDCRRRGRGGSLDTEQFQGIVRVKGQLPRAQLVEHHAERVDVRGRPDERTVPAACRVPCTPEAYEEAGCVKVLLSSSGWARPKSVILGVR